MASHLLKVCCLPASAGAQSVRCIGCTGSKSSGAHEGVTYERNYQLEKIGDREIVGFGAGLNLPTYVDRWDYPFPAIRFQEIKGPLVALCDKQKADWKLLTLDEKKELYRVNFCQTFEEMNVNSKGELLWVLGSTLFLSGVAIWWFIFTEKYCLHPDPGCNPKTLSREWQEKMVRRMVDQHMQPIDGISSKWDYENQRWKE